MKSFREAYASMSYAEKLAIADRLGVTPSTMSRWASDDPKQQRTPDLATAYRIEAVVGVSMYAWVKTGDRM